MRRRIQTRWWNREILSPSTARRNKVVKRALYERVGVEEYWLVDPANEIVDVP